MDFDFSDLYMNSGFDPGDSFDYMVKISLDSRKWSKKMEHDKILIEHWKTAKYKNSNGKESAAFCGIPDDKGGVFMWVIQPRKIPKGQVSIVVYVGEAETGIKRTIKQFIDNIGNQYKGNEFAKKMFEIYSDDLFVTYYEDESTIEKTKVCKELNEIISPPIRYIQGSLSLKGEDL